MAIVMPFQRRPRRDRLAVLVLSGGGNRGAAQVGMLRALVATGYRPDAIVACSVGALNAAFFAADPTAERVEALAEVWRGVRREDVFPAHRLRTVWQVVRHADHLCDPTPLRRLIARFSGTADLSELVIPTDVVTVGLSSGREHYWRSGPVGDVLAASCSLPGIFPPVVLDGEAHTDGGVLRTVPVARAVELGATEITVCDVSTGATEGPVRSPLDVLTRAFSIARHAHLVGDLARASSRAQVRNITLGGAPGYLGWDDFTRTDELIAVGESVARDALAAAAPAPARHRRWRHRTSAVPAGV